MDTVEDFLAHYGRKGMKWGVRAATRPTGGPEPVIVRVTPGKSLRTSGGRGQPASEDAKSHAAKIQKARKSGLHSLSDKELQTLNNRLGMEKKFKDTVPKTKSQKAVQLVTKVLVEQGQKQLTKQGPKIIAALKKPASP